MGVGGHQKNVTTGDPWLGNWDSSTLPLFLESVLSSLPHTGGCLKVTALSECAVGPPGVVHRTGPFKASI